MAELQKEDIKREQLTYSMLKRVIMRADFTAMLNLDNTVTAMNNEEWFKGKFLDYEKRLLEIKEDEDELTDSNDLEGRTVKRFANCTIAPESNITLDISSKFVTMLIVCDDKYSKIDSYLNLFVKVLAFIKESDDYVKFTRLAIRKTDGQQFDSGNDADKVFEYFDQQVADGQHDELVGRSYTDSFIYGGEGIKVHYNRSVKIVGDKFVFILDIDTLKSEEFIENNRPSEQELSEIFEKLNTISFELFKRGVKLEYLMSIMKKDGEEGN